MENNINEEENLNIYKLYVGKMCYRSFNGKALEDKEYTVAGTYDCARFEFYDVLNYKSIPVWNNKYFERNMGRYVVKDMLPLRDYLKENGIDYTCKIKRKDLRNLMEPETVKDDILKRIVTIFHNVENSALSNEEKNDIKNRLLTYMDEYVEKISDKSKTIYAKANVIQNINYSLCIIESMIPGKVEEIKMESTKLRKVLFKK